MFNMKAQNPLWVEDCGMLHELLFKSTHNQKQKQINAKPLNKRAVPDTTLTDRKKVRAMLVGDLILPDASATTGRLKGLSRARTPSNMLTCLHKKACIKIGREA